MTENHISNEENLKELFSDYFSLSKNSKEGNSERLASHS